MKIADVRGEPRTPGGRHANERLRRRGLVPAIIYGHGLPPEPVAVQRDDLLAALAHLQHVVQLQVNGRRELYLIKDVQYDHLHTEPIHVDLMRVDPEERVHVRVAVELRGDPHGVHEGGVLVHVLTDLDVECPLNQIPELLRPDVSHLGLGQALHVRDLELPPGVRPLRDPDEVVAIVRPKRGVEVEEQELAAETAAAEPEVIGRTEREEPEGEEQP